MVYFRSMNKINRSKLIESNPDICHGKPVFKGTRVMVWQVLELLEDGTSAEDIYAAYPTLPSGAIEAALHYAAEKAKGIRYVSFTSEKNLKTHISP
jgi:uncharacterized protein (DUF433 family)